MHIIKQSKVNLIIARIDALQTVINVLKEQGHTQKAKEQEQFIRGLSIALDDLGIKKITHMQSTLQSKLTEHLQSLNLKDYSDIENLIYNELLYTLKEDPDTMDSIKDVRQLCSEVHERIANTLYEVFPEIEAELEEAEAKQ